MEQSKARVRVDLHSHTCFSPDGWTRPEVLVERARLAGIDRIAITDHAEVEGALRAREIDPARVIVGEEIRSRDGTEVIGLFISNRIPDGLPLEEVVEHIHAQGGVVYAPHPFAYLTRADARARRLLALADVVEVFNSRAFAPRWNRLAHAAADRSGAPRFAGSDAHFPWEVGRAFTIMPEFSDAAGFLEAAAHAEPRGLRTASAAIHVGSVSLKYLRLVRDAVGLGGRLRNDERPPVQQAPEGASIRGRS